MAILTVPMNPEYLPELALVIGALFTGGAAIHFALARQSGHAIRAGVASIGCVALTILLAKTMHGAHETGGLKPATTENSVALVLGDVILRVARSDRYTLSVEGRPFLEIDLRQSKLACSAVVGVRDHAKTAISRNTLPSRWADVGLRNPDDNTLLVQEGGESIFRLHYSDPSRIEVTGQFFEMTQPTPALISCQKGITWHGGAIQPGEVIDLRSQGKGSIDFGRSGEIRVRA